MRYDMGRVVIEKQRRGSRSLGRKVRTFGKLVAGEDGLEYYGPTKIPVSRHKQFGYNSKESTDVLRPLHGYLLKNVGRPWDAVWSEMCSILRSGGVGVSHILEAHVNVYDNCFRGIGNGRYYYYDGDAFWGTRIGGNSLSPVRDGFYVDPTTRLLCKGPESPKYRYRPKLEGIRVASGEKWYVLVNGLWFLGTYHKGCDVLGSCGYPIRKKIVDLDKVGWRGTTTYYKAAWPDMDGEHFHCIKSCNKKEIKRVKELLTKTGNNANLNIS